jgi:predicted phosphate transport protein (TIGR00153 family)
MLLFKKEKEVIGLILKHLEMIEQCLMTGIETIEFYLNDNISEAKVSRSSESEADVIRYGIRDKLYSGAYLPLLREDIYKLIESIDKVGNAGEACSDFFLNQRPAVPEEMKAHFLAVAKESLGIIEPLRLAVLCYFKGECKIEVVREHTKDIGMQESRVDKLEWDLTKEIFTSPTLDFAHQLHLKLLDFAHQLHLKLCLDSIVEVSDRAEDAGDQLELATLKSMV